MRRKFKNHKPISASNRIDRATSRNQDWGYVVPNKGGNSANYQISDKDRAKEGGNVQ